MTYAPEDSPSSFTVARVARVGALLLIPISVLVGDFEIRWIQEHAREPLVFWPWFVASVALSIALWAGLITLVRGSRLRFFVLPLVVVPLGTLIVASWRFRTVRHYDPAASVVGFILDEPLYALELASGGFSPAWMAVLVLVPLVWLAVALHGASHEPHSRRLRALSAAAVLAVPIVVWTSWPTVVENPWTPYPTDIRLLKIGEQGVRFYRAGVSAFMMKPTERDEVAPADKHERPSVLVILGESVRNDRTQLWGTPGRATTPRLAALERDHPGEVFAFQRHTANSAATIGSGIGVMLGKHYPEAVEQLRSAPVIWQYAEAAGMQTFLVSAQPWDWSNLVGFYIENQPPQHFYASEHLGLAAVNDAGGDDLQAADKVVDLLTGELAKAPFFGIFQLNASHFPFHASEDVAWPVDSTLARYDAAIARTDAAIGKVLDALDRTGRMDSTVVIFVSDHAIEVAGASPGEQHDVIRSKEPAMFQGARVSSCEPIFIRTPLLMYVPEPWQERLGVDAERLAENTRRLTSHVDVLPTVLDLWSMPSPRLTRPFLTRQVDGQSLLEPVAPDRLVYCYPATRVPELGGVGIHAADRYVYLRANMTRPHVFAVDGPESFTTRRLGRGLQDEDQAIIERACKESPLARGVLEGLDAKFDLASIPCQ